MFRFLPVMLLVFLLGGCSLPRIIVLNDPLDARQHNDLGVSYQQRGDDDLALRAYQRAAELDEDWAQPLLNRGNVFAARQDWAAAAADYRRALRRDPEQAEAMNNLAWVLLQAGQGKEALEWIGQALEREPARADFLDTLADIHLAAGDTAAARQALDRAMAAHPGPDLRHALETKRARLP